jgi:PIN domain nuclease of toxin-antitoxin system
VILLDTHAWLWWSTASRRLSRKAAKAIDSADALGVCAISCWEVAMLVAKGRLVLDRDAEDWLDLALRLPRVQLLALTPRIAARSARLAAGSLKDPADCMIVAAAMDQGCPLVSRDGRVRQIPSVRVVW